MRNVNKPFALMIAVASVTVIGCGQKHPAVSGKVTFNGEPVPMVQVVFTPSAVGDNHTPGPYSVGVTDASGNYTLKTRHKERGLWLAHTKSVFNGRTLNLTQCLGSKQSSGKAKQMPLGKRIWRRVLKKSSRSFPAGPSSDLV